MDEQVDVQVAEAPGVGLDGRERPSEDRVVVLAHAVILLDGATALDPAARSGGWYAGHLATALTERLTAEPAAPLPDLLAAAIGAVAAEHGLVPGSSPSSTVALLRWTEDRVDGLVLADSPVVVFTGDGPQALADDRIATLPRSSGGYRDRLRAGGGFGAGHLTALRAGGSATGRLRNAPGGFWVAEADPAAAAQARTASWPRSAVRAALLASDGVSCGVDDYGLFGWAAVRELAEASGPAAVLAAVRAAERSDPDGARWPRPKPHDDQALAYLRLS